MRAPKLLEHQVEQTTDGIYHCPICLWMWPKPPNTACPGFPRFRAWSDIPEHLMTRSQLRRGGLRPGPVAGVVETSDQGSVWLYDVREARAPRTASQAQRAALAAFRAAQDAARRAQYTMEDKTL